MANDDGTHHIYGVCGRHTGSKVKVMMNIILALRHYLSDNHAEVHVIIENQIIEGGHNPKSLQHKMEAAPSFQNQKKLKL